MIFENKTKAKKINVLCQKENQSLLKNFNRSIHFLKKDEMSSKQNALLVATELLFLQQIKANLA